MGVTRRFAWLLSKFRYRKIHVTAIKVQLFNGSFLNPRIIFHSYYTTNHSRSTIFALSTAVGVSAIAVIRISGPNASDVLFKMGKLRNLPQPRTVKLCKICDPVSHELLDKSLVLWFQGPSSFTGEDMCELHVHGGIAVVKSILNALSKIENFKFAEPGEFSKRAFMANKLDLTEIEGLTDLLHAETEAQQKQALKQMDGVLYKLYSGWSERIKRCLATIEAYIDFSEDQHLDNSMLVLVFKDLEALKVELSNHLSDKRKGERLRRGVSTVLIGKPNVGKSSLLNYLCQRDIAIVSPIAGTTRDIIQTSFNLGGYLVNISDTAGIRSTKDTIEMEGVKRAKDKSSEADLLIFIMEAKRFIEIAESYSALSENFGEELIKSELCDHFSTFRQMLEHNKKFDETCQYILLLNKSDLLNKSEIQKTHELVDRFPQILLVSCIKGTGMNDFLGLFSSIVKHMCSSKLGEEHTLVQERHKTFLQNCLHNIIEFNKFVNIDSAIAAEKLRIAMNELGKITGKVRVDDILDVVFRDFCIGK